jgi:hypothetical protein
MGHLFGLKQYGQTIEWARRAIAINPNNSIEPALLIATLGLTVLRRRPMRRYRLSCAPPSRQNAAVKAHNARSTNPNTDPRIARSLRSDGGGPLKSGMVEGE